MLSIVVDDIYSQVLLFKDGIASTWVITIVVEPR
jgi:hypothetical protein